MNALTLSVNGESRMHAEKNLTLHIMEIQLYMSSRLLLKTVYYDILLTSLCRSRSRKVNGNRTWKIPPMKTDRKEKVVFFFLVSGRKMISTGHDTIF